MSEFSTSATITATLDRGSLRDARSTLEDELSSEPITVDVSTPTARADGGRPGTMELQETADQLLTLADDRNVLLTEMMEALETQAFESAQQGGDSGIGLTGTTLGGGSLVGGASTAAGAIASVLTSGPAIGAGGGLGVPAIGPKLSQAFDQISEDLGGGGFLPDGGSGGGGGTAPQPMATPLMAGPNLEQLLSWEFPDPPQLPSLDWPTPPDPFADTTWPSTPDPFQDVAWPSAPDPFADTGWPTSPDPFADTGWPTSPDPFSGTSWPSTPDPFAGAAWPDAPDPFAQDDWPDPPDPFAQDDWPDPPDPFAQIEWPEPPDPFSGISWPDPPDPFRGFDWPEPPDLEIGVQVEFSKRRLARKLEDVLTDFERKFQDALGG